VPRLDSPFAGEQVAVVGAIGRLLHSRGLDWHDLNAVIAVAQMDLPLGEQSSPRRSPTPPRRPPPPADDRHPIGAADLLRMINVIETRRPSSLGDRSAKFLNQLRSYAGEFDPVRLSPKQWNWLSGLAADAGMAQRWQR
jgi:hypothetical protein